MSLVQAVLSLVLLALMVSQSEQTGMNSGPYDMIVDQVTACKDQGNNKGNFNVSLYLGRQEGSKVKKHLHRGSLSIPFTEEEFYRMEVNGSFYQKKTNDYLLMYRYQEDFCGTMDKVAMTAYRALREAIGLPPDGCVIPTGNYTFNDFEVIFDLPTPMLEYGSYKGTIELLADKEVYGCMEIFAIVKRKY